MYQTYRKSILIGVGFLASLLVWMYYAATLLDSTLQTIKLVQVYGFISLGLLFLLLTPGPLYRLFPTLPFAVSHRWLLSPVGILCFYFALLHSAIGFWGLFDGFNGLSLIPLSFQISFALGFLALFILALLAGTSFDYWRKRMGPRWKTLHRFVYVAVLAASAHVVLSGSHFQSATSWVPSFWLLWFIALLVLNAANLLKLFSAKFPRVPRLVFALISIIGIGAILSVLEFLHSYVHGTH